MKRTRNHKIRGSLTRHKGRTLHRILIDEIRWTEAGQEIKEALIEPQRTKISHNFRYPITASPSQSADTADSQRLTIWQKILKILKKIIARIIHKTSHSP